MYSSSINIEVLVRPDYYGTQVETYNNAMWYQLASNLVVNQSWAFHTNLNKCYKYYYR